MGIYAAIAASKGALWQAASRSVERGVPVEEVSGEPVQVIDELWRPIAREQLERRERGEPLTHRLLELPGVSRRSMGILGPLDSLLSDG